MKEVNYQNLIENLDKNGLLPNMYTQSDVKNDIAENANIFSTTPSFGLTLDRKQPKNDEVKTINTNLNNSIYGYDTDILTDSRFKNIDDNILKLKVKIARLKAELKEHKKITESAYLKSDRAHHQSLLEEQAQIEEELRVLLDEYQKKQFRYLLFSPFTKLFDVIKNHIVLK